MAMDFRVSFDGASPAQKGVHASSLADHLQSLNDISSAKVLRERPDAQDAGSVVSIILGAPALAYALRAITAWCTRNNQSSVTISLPDKTVVFKNLESANVGEAIAALSKLE